MRQVLDTDAGTEDALESCAAAGDDAEVSAAFGALTAVMLLILARLLGQRVADGIARSLDQRRQLASRAR
jgi:hypothetical protein